MNRFIIRIELCRRRKFCRTINAQIFEAGNDECLVFIGRSDANACRNNIFHGRGCFCLDMLHERCFYFLDFNLVKEDIISEFFLQLRWFGTFIPPELDNQSKTLRCGRCFECPLVNSPLFLRVDLMYTGTRFFAFSIFVPFSEVDHGTIGCSLDFQGKTICGIRFARNASLFAFSAKQYSQID